MKSIANFSVGLSQLYFTVSDHMRAALRDEIPSLSPTSGIFRGIYLQTEGAVREILSLPQSWHVFFLSSSHEICERLIANFIADTIVSLRPPYCPTDMLEMIATSLDKKVCRLGFDLDELPTGLPLIHVTHNDFTLGTQINPDLFAHIRSRSPESLIAVNLDTSLPYSTIAWDELDMAYFSVHHGFGLPAGLAVWTVNDRALSMAAKLSLPARGTPDIFQFAEAAHNHQTPAIQNSLAIYLLGKVAKDMITRGLPTIRKETEYKAALWYNCLKQHPTLSAPAVSRDLLSKTILVCEGADEELVQYLNGKGVLVEPLTTNTRLAFANYPVHSKEQYEYLVDTLAAFG